MATATRDDLQAAHRFLDALATLDWDALRACFTPDARLRALVPTTLREEEGPDAIIDRLRYWFGELEDFRLLESGVEELIDRVNVRYRLAGTDPDDGPIVVEQQCYFAIDDGRIAVIDSVCSGPRPAELER